MPLQPFKASGGFITPDTQSYTFESSTTTLTSELLSLDDGFNISNGTLILDFTGDTLTLNDNFIARSTLTASPSGIFEVLSDTVVNINYDMITDPDLYGDKSVINKEYVNSRTTEPLYVSSVTSHTILTAWSNLPLPANLIDGTYMMQIQVEDPNNTEIWRNVTFSTMVSLNSVGISDFESELFVTFSGSMDFTTGETFLLAKLVQSSTGYVIQVKSTDSSVTADITVSLKRFI